MEQAMTGAIVLIVAVFVIAALVITVGPMLAEAFTFNLP